MSGLRQMSGMQPVMSPREQPRGRHPGSWPRGLPSLDGTIRKAPQRPGQPDKEAQCSPCDTGHGPPEQARHPRAVTAQEQGCLAANVWFLSALPSGSLPPCPPWMVGSCRLGLPASPSLSFSRSPPPATHPPDTGETPKVK